MHIKTSDSPTHLSVATLNHTNKCYFYKQPVTFADNPSLIVSQGHKKPKQDLLSKVLHCKVKEMLPQSFKISTYKGL